MNCRKPSASGPWVLVALSALFFSAGCGAVEEEVKPISFMRDQPGAVFPVMFHNKRVYHEGRSWRLRVQDISNVELHEINEETPEVYTAILSFNVGDLSERFRLRVTVTYKRDTEKNDKGFEFMSYAVRNLKALSSERVREE